MTEGIIGGGNAPTLEMVAALAGVSRSTVSRVVNASTQVTPEVVAAVNSAIAQLNYVPNRAARSLASRRTDALALVIPENTAKFFADPYFASVIQGAAMYLATTRFTLSLVIASETETQKTRRYLSAGNVDGALILSHHSDDRSYVQLGRSLPVVFGGRPISEGGENSYVVDVDNVTAGLTATQYLIDHGKTRIATIAGPEDMASGIDRVDGWRKAITAAGLEPGPVEVGDFTLVGGAAAMERMLATTQDFDGLFVANSLMASGALSVLSRHGRTVPGDVGIVTIDNDFYASNSNPPLTTIEQPTLEQGAKMAEVLVRVIAGEDVPKFTSMPTKLIERESV